MTATTTHLLASSRHLDDLAHALAADGPARHERAIRRVVTTARTAGLHGAALDALADPTRPDVVRLRAFAHVHADLRSVLARRRPTGRDRIVA